MAAPASQPTQTQSNFELGHEINGNSAAVITFGERIDPAYRHEGWDTSVYEASIGLDQDTVAGAIKVVNNPTDARMAEFVIENEILTVLPEHKNIVKMIESGSFTTDDGRVLPYMLKEKANMGTLANHMHDLTDDQYLEIERDIAYGLAFLEEYNIADGDVTPANIGLFTDEEGKITAKIIDLGSARPIDNDPDKFSADHSIQFNEAVEFLVEKNHSPGTRDYVSPEAMLGSVEPSTAKDMWALGRIAILVGKEHPSEEIGKIRYEDEVGEVDFVIDPNKSAIPKRTSVVANFIKQSLQLDPSKRPSAKQAAEQLDHGLQLA